MYGAWEVSEGITILFTTQFDSGTIFTDNAQLETLSTITKTRIISTVHLGWIVGLFSKRAISGRQKADLLVVVECQPGMVISY